MAALTLTGMIPTIYEAMDIVRREVVGMIPAVSQDFQAERAALNETITSPVVPAMAAQDVTPAAYAQDYPTQQIDNVQMTISKSRTVPFGITGEETVGLRNSGTLGRVNRDRIVQAMRTLTNEVEGDLATVVASASRAYGTYNGTPFGTADDLTDFADPYQILTDNGAPIADRHMVLGGAALSRMKGKQAVLFRANEAATDELLRRGMVNEVQGFGIHNSAQMIRAGSVTVGTAASATTDATGYAVGATTIGTAAAGTGTILAGDIVTFAGDSNQYVVATGNADVTSAGSIVLNKPGLMQALPTSATAITVVAASNRDAFFHRGAIQLATRVPAEPDGGDDADDVMLVTDPVSQLTYEFRVYKQYRQVRYEIGLAWGWQVLKEEFLGMLIGK